MSATLDVLAALTAYADAEEERGDEHLAHVSDLAACDRETWARRRGEPMLEFDPATRRKFALGNSVEEYVLDAIARSGVDVRRNIRVALREVNGELLGRELDEREAVAPAEIVGHLDGDLPDAVVEVKSTTFRLDRKTWIRVIPTRNGVNAHYLVQAAAYAIARGKPRFTVVIVCRESGEAIAYDYSVDDQFVDGMTFRDFVAMRVPELIENTAPHAPMPAANPPEAWRCKYCKFRACEKWRGKS